MVKVFLSWSGEASLKVANLLNDWLPSVIQDVQPYVSAEDIHKGERWSPNLANTLASYGFGLILVTQENISAPWIMFEAGALSKDIEHSRVVPILCGISQTDLVGNPLDQFQSASLVKTDIGRVCKSLNFALNENTLSEERLSRAFEKWWPELENGLKDIDLSVPSKSAKKHKGEGAEIERIEMLLEELLRRGRNEPDLAGYQRQLDRLRRENVKLQSRLESISGMNAFEARVMLDNMTKTISKMSEREDGPEIDELMIAIKHLRDILNAGFHVS